MIKLYDHAVSGNCYKVRLALSQLGVEYERINVDIFKGEQNERWFAALNPNKKVPVLIDGDFTMWESNGILLYIGKKFGPHNFLAGSYSIADIGCYAYVHTAEEGEVSLSPFPAVLSWCDRIRSQPRYISMED